MDYGRSGNYYRRGRSPSQERYQSKKSRSPERSYSPHRNSRANWSRDADRRGRSPERYSSSWRVNSPKPRSRSRSYDRSRSRSRGRGRFSRSPNGFSSRKSPVYESFRRKRRNSSSSESGLQHHSRSSSARGREEPKDEFYRSMYADHEEEKQRQSSNKMHHTNSRNANNALQSDSNSVAFGPEGQQASKATGNVMLTQGYKTFPSSKTFPQDVEDEDRFLYGDDNTGPTVVEKPKAEPSQEEPTKALIQNSAVTPGGFDSNALKNVLKAIGFDFELSAQQTKAVESVQTVKKSEAVEEPMAAETKEPQPHQPQAGDNAPQPIQTIGQITQPKSKTQEQMEQQSVMQYYQPYDPYNPTSHLQYNPSTVQTSQQVASLVYANNAPTPLGYPMTIPDPNNPCSTLLVYRPVSQSTANQTNVYHPPDAVQAISQSQMQGGRVVLPPQRSEDTKSIAVKEPEKDERQERLNYLQEELEKLKKQQNELLRKKKKEKDVSKDSAHAASDHAEVIRDKDQLEEIRQAAERAAGIASDSSDKSDAESKGEKLQKYEYLDPGNHWCQLCGTISSDLAAFLSHLHGKTHRKTVDPYDRPWDEGQKARKQKSLYSKTKSLKGAEFLIPITGYYCTLCRKFSGDQICADDHLKSQSHNDVYKRYCKKNPPYEKKYKKKKKIALEDAESTEKTVERVEKIEIKVENKSPKSMKEKWVEKTTRNVKEKTLAESRPSDLDGVPLLPEFGPYASDKKVYKLDKKISESSESTRRDSRSMEKRIKKEPGIAQRELDQKKVSYRERPALKHQSSTHGSDLRNEQTKREKQSADHGRRKINWSPGYDEYEKVHQSDNHSSKWDSEDKETNERSRNRNRHNRWVEKQQSGSAKASDSKVPVASEKIPRPGFGKFSWNSGAIRNSRRFDQTPVDKLASSHGQEHRSEDVENKGRIAIKITGKTQYPPRLSNSKALVSKGSRGELEKKAVAEDLRRKVDALKRENCFRNQLTSASAPTGRQSKPNTAAVMLGTRTIGKHNTLLLAKSLRSVKYGNKGPGEIVPHEIEADVSPPPPPADTSVKPPPPAQYEPPPPGEEDMDLGVDDDARSDASGISMELASDEG